MRCNYAMTTSSVTPPTDEEGADMEGAKEAGGAAVSIRGYFGRSWATLRLTVATSMTHMTKK